MNPTPKRLILNLLMASDDETMSAQNAVAACALFGVRENTARVTLVRLASAGLIESAGRGAYRLGPAAVELAHDVATWRAAEQRVREWGGAWIAVHLGSIKRADPPLVRSRQRALSLLGLRELGPGLWVRPDNLTIGVEGVRSRLYTLGLDQAAHVFVAQRFDAAREARARMLWDGVALNTSYRDTIARLEQWLASAQALEAEVAARESFLLGDKAIRQLVYDPLLPAPLIDVELRRAFSAAVLRFDEAGHAIWRQLLTSNFMRAAPLQAALRH